MELDPQLEQIFHARKLLCNGMQRYCFIQDITNHAHGGYLEQWLGYPTVHGRSNNGLLETYSGLLGDERVYIFI